MTFWLALRLIKFAALFLLVAGMSAVSAQPNTPPRVRTAYWVVFPAFVASWACGYAMMKATGRTLEPWILIASAASLASLFALVRLAHWQGSLRLATAVMWGGLAAATAEMILRPEAAQFHGLALGMGAATAAALVLWGKPPTPIPPTPPDTETDAATSLALRWWGRIEGASLIALLALSVARRALELDLGMFPAVAGWVHGTLVFLWFIAIAVSGPALRWSLPQIALGGMSALLPFGTFVFEGWMSKRGREPLP